MITVRDLVAALLLLPACASACTCADRRLSEEEKIVRAFDRAALVVVARVAGLSTSSSGVFLTTTGIAEVLESLKQSDNLPMQIPIQMRASREGYTSSCGEGAELHEGDYLLLYLSEPRVTEEDFTYCDRSTVSKRRADFNQEVERLRILNGEG